MNQKDYKMNKDLSIVKEKIFLSIILVTYNCEQTIRQTIESIYEQTFQNYEVIIIDGKSTDKTNAIINEYIQQFNKKKIVFNNISEEDDGIYDAMNKGINLSQGEWLFFIGADDTFYNKNALKNFYIQSKKTDADIIYGNVNCCYSNRKIVKTEPDSLSKFTFLRNTICHQAIFTKKNVFKNIGLFNIIYSLKADYEWQLRAWSTGYEFVHINQLIVNYNMSGASSNIDINRKETIKILKKYYSIIFVALKKISWMLKDSKNR